MLNREIFPHIFPTQINDFVYSAHVLMHEVLERSHPFDIRD